MDKRREQRVEDAGRGESDADDIDGESSCKVCEYDAPASAGHANRLGNVPCAALGVHGRRATENGARDAGEKWYLTLR